ncbi:hypothetical protein HK105_209112 [Polyrhizophydium stewartii]|uniref:Uncharacterized protein n=1 Tax=Polyrhizophydium stewartii TaxID=2732419 RepID=A0ABR4MVY6_9FUNG
MQHSGTRFSAVTIERMPAQPGAGAGLGPGGVLHPQPHLHALHHQHQQQSQPPQHERQHPRLERAREVAAREVAALRGASGPSAAILRAIIEDKIRHAAPGSLLAAVRAGRGTRARPEFAVPTGSASVVKLTKSGLRLKDKATDDEIDRMRRDMDMRLEATYTKLLKAAEAKNIAKAAAAPSVRSRTQLGSATAGQRPRTAPSALAVTKLLEILQQQQTVQMSESLVTQMTSLVSARIEPLLVSAQRRLETAADKIESQLLATPDQGHATLAPQAPPHSEPQVVTLTAGAGPEEQSPPPQLEQKPSPLPANEAVDDAVSALPASPVVAAAVEPALVDDSDGPLTEIRRDPFDPATDAATIVIQKISQLELAQQQLAQMQAEMARTAGLRRGQIVDDEAAAGQDLRKTLQTLFLPRSMMARIQDGRDARMRHLAALMGTAVVSPLAHAAAAQGPWDALESAVLSGAALAYYVVLSRLPTNLYSVLLRATCATAVLLKVTNSLIAYVSGCQGQLFRVTANVGFAVNVSLFLAAQIEFLKSTLLTFIPWLPLRIVHIAQAVSGLVCLLLVASAPLLTVGDEPYRPAFIGRAVFGLVVGMFDLTLQGLLLHIALYRLRRTPERRHWHLPVLIVAGAGCVLGASLVSALLGEPTPFIMWLPTSLSMAFELISIQVMLTVRGAVLRAQVEDPSSVQPSDVEFRESESAAAELASLDDKVPPRPLPPPISFRPQGPQRPQGWRFTGTPAVGPSTSP